MDKSQYKRYSKEGRNASNRMTVCNNKLKDAQEKMKNEKKKREKYTGPTLVLQYCVNRSLPTYNYLRCVGAWCVRQ